MQTAGHVVILKPWTAAGYLDTANLKRAYIYNIS